ncbi:major facilitator superfamily MFS_1 [Kribbella flavida DSM 17836]|uniref:Major facilitator superfamily MFS_1 n=1 Tax=Kribbella flavida (strain DSM 17836 / JCM 10339 / NBRC 14399) TaxID=479435 RepID=D2PS86_KRIFD|nr:MFS transporter [Kribbella flavida]ADB31210.1 major facilitator superfamily MFS_1 [Kribbella flavida DSM 17836]
MPHLPAACPPNLWTDRDFVKLWIGHTASQFGAQTAQFTLPLVALIALGGGAAELGGLRAAQQVPILLCSLFVGVLVDRLSTRTLMVYADLARALALAAVPVAFLLDALGLPLLSLIAFLVGVFTVFFDVAYQACLPRLVQRGQLAQGNSLLESSRSATQICGPALGGGLVALLTAPLALAAGAVFFILSFASIRRIRRPDPPAEYESHSAGMLPEIKAGLRLVLHDRALRAIGLASATHHFFFAALMTTYLVFLTTVLRLPSGVLGLVLAALGPGALLGAVFSAKLPRLVGYGPVMVVAALAADLVLLCVPALRGAGAATVVVLMVVNVAFGALSQLVDVSATAVRQAVVPIRSQGRVVATLNFVGMGLTPLGSVLAGVLAGPLGIRTVLLLSVSGMFLSPLCLALSPLRRLGRTLPGET